ncbi:MAG: DUF2505 domain-containing protein [Actinomycetota bacterium]|nr:DUF2505 domain-containing protein [Actinomycetota bacterium]
MRVEHDYDVAPDALLAVLTDEAFLAARSSRYGGNGEPSVDKSADEIVVTVPRQLPLDAVPAPFRRFAGNGELVQTDTWSELSGDPVRGTWTIDPGDSPLELAGTHEIAATGTGCRYTVTADVKVRIRFIGGQVESLVSQQLVELVAKEQEFAETWISERR